MRDNILVSVIMPALNSEKTIEKAILSVRNQTIDQDTIEILVIDGGSVDNTRSIAGKYKARIIENLEVVPEAAKRIGLHTARGKYAIWLDTDEELASPNQLEKRIALFRTAPGMKAIILNGYITPESYPSLSTYINSYGDAFSYFVYRFDATNMINSLRKYPHEIYETGHVFHFSDRDITPIGDGGSTMFDLEYARSQFGENLSTQEFAVTIFQQIVTSTGCVGIVPGDQIIHYATSTKSTFLKKLRFRALTNVHGLAGYGFVAREKLNKAIYYRKLMFGLYCLFFPWPLWDGIHMSIVKKKPGMLIHVFFTYYILINVLLQYFLKLLRIKSVSGTYGK